MAVARAFRRAQLPHRHPAASTVCDANVGLCIRFVFCCGAIGEDGEGDVSSASNGGCPAARRPDPRVFCFVLSAGVLG